MLFTKVVVNIYFFYFLQIMSVFLAFLKETSILVKFFPTFIVANFIISYFYLLNEGYNSLKNTWIMTSIFSIVTLLFLFYNISFYEGIIIFMAVMMTQIMMKVFINLFPSISRDKIYICISLFMIFISSICGLLYSPTHMITISLLSIGIAMMPLNFLLSFTRNYYNELGFYINWTSIISHIITIIFIFGCGRLICIDNFYKIHMIFSLILFSMVIYAKFPRCQQIEEKFLHINKEFLYTVLGFILSVIVLHYARFKLSTHITHTCLIGIFVGKIIAALWFLYLFKGDFRKGNEKLFFTCGLLIISTFMIFKFGFLSFPWMYMGLIEIIGGFLLPVYILVYAPQYLIITSGLCNLTSAIIAALLNKIFLF